jgi:GH24 family phage-related lysozyme (muramidase)
MSWPSVQEEFIFFSAQFEGRLRVMYCDIKGLVTTGIGNLIDLALPWLDFLTNQPASQGDVIAEWTAVKALGGNHPLQFWPTRAKLVLNGTDVDKLVLNRLEEFEAQLKSRPCFAAFDVWPADAQLGLLSMAWAAGAEFNFPLFEAACESGNFLMAAIQCAMDTTGNPGLVPRNTANRTLFSNAAKVKQLGLPISTLQYPKTL